MRLFVPARKLAALQVSKTLSAESLRQRWHFWKPVSTLRQNSTRVSLRAAGRAFARGGNFRHGRAAAHTTSIHNSCPVN
jgi:hypothetical protein